MYEALVAPLILLQDELLAEDCHWYVIVPYGAVAATVIVFVAPRYTVPPVGCVVKVGAVIPTVTLAAEEVADAVYPLSVFVITHR